jgi:hypothetical protein
MFILPGYFNDIATAGICRSTRHGALKKAGRYVPALAVVGDYADRILVLTRNNPGLHVDTLPTGRLISILQSVGGNCCHGLSGV